VTTWAEAHHIALVAAAQAHRALGVDPSEPPIDVAAAIFRAQVLLMWRPMPQLFGVYVNEPGSHPGIMVSTGLPNGARRHTAAHELGHHRLGHTTSVDDGSTVDTGQREDDLANPAAVPGRPWAGQEKVAEAFAAWFLMPRRAVMTGLERLGIGSPRTPLDVYQLSLHLGTSYRSTARHLPNLRLARADQVSQWMAVAPNRIKAALDHGFESPPSRAPDVWRVDSGLNAAMVLVQPGDRIVVVGDADHRVDYPSWLSAVPTQKGPQDERLVLEVPFEGTAAMGTISVALKRNGAVHDSAAWKTHIVVDEPPRGLDPRWIS
jgi:hypothetical protein